MLNAVYEWLRSLTPDTKDRMSRKSKKNCRFRLLSKSEQSLYIKPRTPFCKFRSVSDSHLIVVKPRVTTLDLVNHMKQTTSSEELRPIESFSFKGKRCKGDSRITIW